MWDETEVCLRDNVPSLPQDIFSIKAATATEPSVIFQLSSNKLIHRSGVDSVEPLNTLSHGNDDDVVGFMIFKYGTRYPVCV